MSTSSGSNRAFLFAKLKRVGYRFAMQKLRAFSVLAATALLCTIVHSASAQTHQLRKITFSGATDYTQDELLSFTGLKPGMAATQQQIEDAAQKLGNTGLFEDVNFSGNDDGVTYILKTAAARATMPVRFGNFVWWQDEEIDHALKAKVPLYRGGTLPVSGNMRQAVADALTAMVTEKGVANASVSSTLNSSKVGGAPDRILFAIGSPQVLIHSVTFTGTSQSMQSKLEPVRTDLANQPWDEVDSLNNVTGRAGDVYRNDGYLDIVVARPERSAPTMTAAGISVDLTAALTEGSQYHVKQLVLSGSPIVSADDFKVRAELHVGDPASPLRLAQTLMMLKSVYGTKGYIDAKVDAPQQIDATAHTVSYTVDVAQGPQYHLRSVRFPNISLEEEKQFLAQWKMKPGDVYDQSYAVKFMDQHMTLAQHGYTSSIQELKDTANSVVDLAIRINKPGAPPQ